MGGRRVGEGLVGAPRRSWVADVVVVLREDDDVTEELLLAAKVVPGGGRALADLLLMFGGETTDLGDFVLLVELLDDVDLRDRELRDDASLRFRS